MFVPELITAEDLLLKERVLSDGVSLTPEFLRSYGPEFLEKRLAYGNSDHIQISRRVPQELLLGDGRLVTAVHLRPDSANELDFDGDFVLRVGDSAVPLDFPRRPAFYETDLDSGERVKNVITLYGGASLGVFVYGSCNLVDIGQACQYCSIEPNHENGVDFVHSLSPGLVKEAVGKALMDAEAPIEQVMINGGNFPAPARLSWVGG